MQLDEILRRVLGVLLEKSMSQPQSYPMTVNSIVAGCNQKTNRWPLMDLDEEAVWSALTELQGQGLVTRVLPPPGSRADRFKHEVPGQLGWQSPQRAIMTELMLRGPQTVGELRGRCSRLHPFESLADVERAMEMFLKSDPPLIRPLPREPGRSAVRFDHTLYVDGEISTAGPPEAGESPAEARRSDAVANSSEVASDGLTAQVAALAERLVELERRVEALEGRT